ncbi:hypothetical protein LguiB_020763 [Lonicera macranthoides]
MLISMRRLPGWNKSSQTLDWPTAHSRDAHGHECEFSMDQNVKLQKFKSLGCKTRNCARKLTGGPAAAWDDRVDDAVDVQQMKKSAEPVEMLVTETD